MGIPSADKPVVVITVGYECQHNLTRGYYEEILIIADGNCAYGRDRLWKETYAES